MARQHLSVRDEVKPLILIAAIAAGIGANRLAAGRLTHLDWITDAAIFAVMFAVMAFVEVKDVAVAFRKVKPTVLALVTNFVITPAFAWALGWLILRHYPDLWAGVILYTLTPCIGWYLIFTDQAKGDVAWGVSLLPWNLVLQIALLPCTCGSWSARSCPSPPPPCWPASACTCSPRSPWPTRPGWP